MPVYHNYANMYFKEDLYVSVFENFNSKIKLHRNMVLEYIKIGDYVTVDASNLAVEYVTSNISAARVSTKVVEEK